ncbi:MAG TPA: SdrD B-like domain-containing protein [Anaerolineales bacterium]|nr:SdrD B-like domain-containing protein [Anaerolineales bacterium]
MSRLIQYFSPSLILIIALLLGSCSPTAATPTHSLPAQTTNPITVSTLSPTAQAITAETAAPALAADINPLTGLPVQDPSLLQIPAVLLSISHFPVEARPQAGLSFVPYVFEIYITEGATRFLATFYGQFPAPEAAVSGDCAVRGTPFTQTNLILGNRVWNDSNLNSTYDAWENGIGGVCVNLYDTNGMLLQQTTTDSNGYYGFNVEAGNYIVEFLKPPGMEFVQKHAWEDERDSDADPVTGRTDTLSVGSSILHADAGLIPVAASGSPLPPALVGPVRSGRLVYRHIAAFFPDSCLIYAGASPEVLVHLPYCAFVEHIIDGGGYMLEIDRMVQLARENQEPDQTIEYSSNIFSVEPPEGGIDAAKLHVYIAWLNQSAWVFDPLSQSWWRYVDNADPETAGIVHPEIDRLTGRQLHFENLIVVFAQHEIISPTNLEIRMEQDWIGEALLFRDGKMYKGRWSTVATDEEVETGRRKPIQFLYPDNKTPFPLKPGRTWILVMTPQTPITERSPGEWLLQFFQPPGAQ